MKKKSLASKRTVNGETAPGQPVPGRGDGTAPPARKVAHLTPEERRPGEGGA